jgi:hypothetical protein
LLLLEPSIPLQSKELPNPRQTGMPSDRFLHHFAALIDGL